MMPDKLTQASLELRTRIARSRRRIDQNAIPLLDPGSWCRRASNRNRPRFGQMLLAVLGTTYPIVRWVIATRRAGRDDDPLRSFQLPTSMERLVRRIRVLAWQYRRKRRHPDSEATNE